jgi:hypothetical protein
MHVNQRFWLMAAVELIVFAWCRTVTPRLAEHLKTSKNPKITDSECQRTARNTLDKLLSNSVVKLDELKRICKIRDKSEQFYALKGLMVRLGHIFDQASESNVEQQSSECESINQQDIASHIAADIVRCCAC